MKRLKLAFLFILLTSLLIDCQKSTPQNNEQALRQKAENLAHKFMIVDTHIDVPYRVYHHKNVNISQQTDEGHFDYPRARKGGLDLAFMSVYVPASYEDKGAKMLADSLIDMVNGFAITWPDKFEITTSVEAARKQFGDGKISFAMGMENGSPIEHNLSNVDYFYNRGIRYITLAHSENNHISDSSYDQKPKWHGLSPFGEKVVKEMNRVGIMVDISHITDEAIEDVLRVSSAPVIASHSSARFFTPGMERNISDELIEQVAEKGGVVQVAFGSFFINNKNRLQSDSLRKVLDSYLHEHHLSYQDSAGRAFVRKFRKEHPPIKGDVSEVANHIDHIVQLVGVDHAGFGSDFDGVRTLPVGLEDVSMYPNLIYELLKKGYTEQDIKKICGENLLRVWSEVEKTAQRLQTEAD